MNQRSENSLERDKDATPKELLITMEQQTEEARIFDAFNPNNDECWEAILTLKFDEQQQTLLAEFAEMWEKVDYISVPERREKFVFLLRLAVASLVIGKNMIFVEKTRDLSKQIIDNYYKRRILYHLPGILLGLFLFLYCAIIIGIVIPRHIDNTKDIIGIPSNLFFASIIFGTLGSTISIMLRHDKMVSENTNLVTLLFTGFSKPIIGGVFALIILCIYKAGLIPVKIGGDQEAERYFLLTMFFLSGFSERFVSDAFSKVENLAVVQHSDNK